MHEGSSAPRLRRATSADVEVISAIHVRSWQWAYRGLLPDVGLDALTPADRVPVWREALGPRSTHRLWLAEVDGRGVGFAAWGPSRDAGAAPGAAELYALYLERGAAGTGVAAALLDAVLREMTGFASTSAHLWVLERNPRARRFYERCGFTADGGRKVVNLLGTELTAVRYASPPLGA